ncbi:MAG: putative Ig domain-containing protein, partial [Thermoplasmata archaeon]|nr:putative Ig domain-containing protein [Thermoplasmata archaeon]
FGASVSVSGDTIVIGAFSDDGGRGSAYVFTRNNGGTDYWGQVTRITASDRATDDYFGYSVSISFDTIVVGAFYGDVGANANQGSAYTFNQVGNTWVEIGHPVASDGAVGDWFGTSVAVSGDTIVVGASGDSVGANVSQGSAYVFTRNYGGADNWGQVKKITASDGEAGDNFGNTVSVSGDTIVVGASGDDVAGVDQGSAYVFTRNYGGADNWGQVKKLIAGDGEADDWFGSSVSISGETIVVGAVIDGVDGVDQGSAYVFTRNYGGTDNWGQVKRLTASDGAAFYYFGESVSVSGDTIVVGAGSNDLKGAAYVFTRNYGGADYWGQVKKLTASDGATNDLFGVSVSVSGDTIVVGACRDDVDEIDEGSAYVFTRNYGGADNWGQVKHIAAYDRSAGDYFGASVSVSGDTIVVGASNDFVGTNSYQGSAYVFTRNNGGADNWGLVTNITAGDGAANDYFGRDVSISGDTIVVGAHYDDVGANLDQGSAYIYHFDFIISSPTITTVDITAAIVDTLYSVDYDATDPNIQDVLTWSLATNAPWLNIVPSTGVLSGTPGSSNLGTYWVNVSVSDGNGGTDWTNFTLTVKLPPINLGVGWNLISIPLELANASVENVLASVSGMWDVVKYYDVTDVMDPWKTYRIGGTVNDLAFIDRTMGIWVHATDNCSLEVFGTIHASTDIVLHAGWNLVGYPTLTAQMVGLALWGTGADRVEVFDPVSPYIKEVGGTYLMKPGEGYWIRVPAETIWTIYW